MLINSLIIFFKWQSHNHHFLVKMCLVGSVLLPSYVVTSFLQSWRDSLFWWIIIQNVPTAFPYKCRLFLLNSRWLYDKTLMLSDVLHDVKVCTSCQHFSNFVTESTVIIHHLCEFVMVSRRASDQNFFLTPGLCTFAVLFTVTRSARSWKASCSYVKWSYLSSDCICTVCSTRNQSAVLILCLTERR